MQPQQKDAGREKWRHSQPRYLSLHYVFDVKPSLEAVSHLYEHDYHDPGHLFFQACKWTKLKCTISGSGRSWLVQVPLCPVNMNMLRFDYFTCHQMFLMCFGFEYLTFSICLNVSNHIVIFVSLFQVQFVFI